jgi:small-conductance mechanosensitive channel
MKRQVKWILWLILIIQNCAVPLSFGENDPQPFFPVEAMNAGLSKADQHIDLTTPRVALEHFLDQGRVHNFHSASHTLNLNKFSSSDQKTKGPELTEQLYFVLNQKIQINWSQIPDRPDGTLDVPLDNTSPLAGKPRRSIKIGSITFDNREVEIRLARYKAPDSPAQWQFSEETVNKIPQLYAQFGPGPLVKYFHPAIKRRVLNDDPLGQIFVLVFIGIISFAIGWSVNRMVMGFFERSTRKHLSDAARRLRTPSGIFFSLIMFDLIAFSLISLSGPLISDFGPILKTLLILSITWFIIRITEVVTDFSSHQYTHRIDTEGEQHARQMTTHISVARRVIIFITIVFAVGFILRQFQMFENLSFSLLASAGVASVILGVAAHSVLGNIMAGMQVAITQPACIGDAVRFEKEWGFIEAITYTYITIRTWDLRRVVIPLSYFIEHPFENWSMKDAHIIKPIYLYVDYRMDVSHLRQKFKEILENSPEWDRQTPPVMQVTGLTEEAMELRALCSAKDGKTAWSLQCAIREQLVAFLQEFHGGRYLPKQRVLLEKDQFES